MEKRVLIAIVLSFMVLYLYQSFVVRPTDKPVGGTVTSPAAETESRAPTPAVTPDSASAPGRVNGGTPVPPPAPPAVADSVVGEPTERDVRVETDTVLAVFTNRGARLKSWQVKGFRDQGGKPLDLVPPDLATTEELPFSLDAGDAALNAAANGGLYAVQGTTDRPVSEPTNLRFEYLNRGGLHVTKEFHFEPHSYVVTLRTVMTDGARAVVPRIHWGPAVGDSGAETSSYVRKPEGLLFLDGKAQRRGLKEIAQQSTYEGDFRYAGVDDHYFMTVVLFPGRVKISYRPVSAPPLPGFTAARELVAYAISQPAGGEPVKFFAGPKHFDVLAAIDRDLTRAIDFGIFAFLVVPLLRSLNWLYGYVGNYGWAIILLTIIINAAMFPLRHKSVVSMRKMQEIQPEVKAIQDRYAKLKTTDPERQKMNQELMALYRARGVNPASGCVPMLLTMPVLFAFYSLLSVAIELRGAPFFGWIQDLSAHDPFYVAPVLMGASQLWQQRITPAAGADPAQQKMMMAMPVVFMFMFLWAPAGLAVYWFVSNLWAIGQQYATNYLIGPPKVHAVRPPAERKMKRVGGGKTEAAARESEP